MRKSLLLFAVATLMASVPVHAEKNTSNVHYKWIDGHGLAHFSDSLTAEAMKYGYDLVDDQGLVMRHVQRQLTPDEREAAQKLAAQQAEQARIKHERQRAEAQMMSAYPDEASYQAAQHDVLATIDQHIHTTRINLHSQETALTDLLGRAADTERAKNPVPKSLADSIIRQRDVVAAQRRTLQRQQAERTRTLQLQAKQLARYRELKAGTEQPAE